MPVYHNSGWLLECTVAFWELANAPPSDWWRTKVSHKRGHGPLVTALPQLLPPPRTMLLPCEPFRHLSLWPLPKPLEEATDCSIHPDEWGLAWRVFFDCLPTEMEAPAFAWRGSSFTLRRQLDDFAGIIFKGQVSISSRFTLLPKYPHVSHPMLICHLLVFSAYERMCPGRIKQLLQHDTGIWLL